MGRQNLQVLWWLTTAEPVIALCKASLSTAPLVRPSAIISLVSCQIRACSTLLSKSSLMYKQCTNTPLSAGVLIKVAVIAAVAEV